jgi:D-sedoheptulose 7-phosphate isomerase
MSEQQTIERYCRALAEGATHLPFGELARVADALMDCHRRGGTIFIAGNGGSAATASHFATDLTKGTRNERIRRFRVVALTDSVPLLTAWGNDTSYDRVFAEQLLALGTERDLLLTISASGNSPNVLEAVRAARSLGLTTVALAGPTGGKVAELADITVRAPGDTIEQIEDLHSMVTHALTVALRGALEREAAESGVGGGPTS